MMMRFYQVIPYVQSIDTSLVADGTKDFAAVSRNIVVNRKLTEEVERNSRSIKEKYGKIVPVGSGKKQRTRIKQSVRRGGAVCEFGFTIEGRSYTHVFSPCV
jgi:hypothetical protein